MRIPSGVTDQYIYFVAVDATDLNTRETALATFTVYRSRDGAAAAAMTTPTINETDVSNMPGVYELLLDEDMTIGSGNDSEEMALHITHAGMAPVTRVIELYRSKITVGETLGVASGNISGSVATLVGHTAQTGDSFARIGVAGAGLTGLGGMAAGMQAEVNSAVDTAFTTQMADSVAADGVIPTREQQLLMVGRFLMERSAATTIVTVTKEDGATSSMTFTLDDPDNPTSITRSG